ncbi:hypothetical protein [Paenibacillus sabinae]|nr:hypothetical protein [Paenibacillus sabinae]
MEEAAPILGRVSSAAEAVSSAAAPASAIKTLHSSSNASISRFSSENRS